MGLEYYELPDHPTAMSADNLARYLSPDESDAIIMRSLLMAELKRCQAEEVEPRTLRGLWYSLVKPSLSKLGLLNPNLDRGDGRRGPKRTKLPSEGQLAGEWADKLSQYLAELVREGVCTYADMLIVDGSRQRRPTQPYLMATDSVQLVGVHYPNVIIFTEKDTIYQVLRDVASVYGISALSGGGGPSFACTENLVDQIEERSDGDELELVLIGLTDYDPAGYTIFEAQANQLADTIESRQQFAKVKYWRIGLTPDQLTDDELINNTYHPPTKGLNKWFRETGGVNGQPLGLELDALPLSRIRRMFVEAIGRFVQESPYHDDLRQALIRLMVDDVLSSRFNQMRAGLMDQVNGSVKLDCDDDILRRAALAGESFVNPYRAFDDGDINELRQVLIKAAEDV